MNCFKYHSEYGKGYFKALLDICGLLEKCEESLKSARQNNISAAVKIIKLCMQDKERLMMHGSDLSIVFCIDNVKKGKKTVKEFSVVFEDNPKWIERKRELIQNQNNPCHKSYLYKQWMVLNAVYSEKVAIEHFKEEFGENFDNLNDDAKEYYLKIVNGEK